MDPWQYHVTLLFVYSSPSRPVFLFDKPQFEHEADFIMTGTYLGILHWSCYHLPSPFAVLL
jgi:hypothetical protein